MRYLTAEELKETARDHAHEILERCAGKSVRDLFAIRVFNTYHDRMFGDRAKTRLLDLGSASGAFAEQLSESGYRDITGIDIDDYVSPERKSVFRSFRTADLATERLPWPDRSFDAIAAWCVLPHLENPFHCIREIARVMAPGGLFIFTAPHLGSKPSRRYFLAHGDFKSYRATNNHIALFTPGVVQKTVLRYFAPIATEYHFRPKIFRGPKGKLRQAAYRLAGLEPAWQKTLDYRWAYNAVYVLRKQQADAHAP